jgi:hypothetical protein
MRTQIRNARSNTSPILDHGLRPSAKAARADSGYILYSVGDEGRGEDDSKEPKWRVVRMEH